MRVHISLNVSSLERSLGFYSNLFGQEASKLRKDYANFRLDEPPVHLALVAHPATGPGGVSHLGFELPHADVLTAWRQRLENAGMDFAVEDQARCCYAKADKLWLTDPDGYRWEIWVRTGEHDGMGGTRLESASRSQAGQGCCAA